MSKELVVSKTYRQALEYAHREGWGTGEWVYVRDWRFVRGMENPKVTILGYPELWSESSITDFEWQLLICDRGESEIKRRLMGG